MQVLLCLFWLVFTIMGMHVFGGLELQIYSYPNFDTFLNSLVSTFNVSVDHCGQSDGDYWHFVVGFLPG